MNRFMLAAFVLIVLWVSPTSGVREAKAASQSDAEVRQKAETLSRNWRTVKPDMLRDPAYAEAIERLRAEAQEPHRNYARMPLLRMGDPQMTAQCIAEFRTRQYPTRGNAAQQLKKSANPAVISLIADDLFRDESTATVYVTPEFPLRPISVYAGDIIRAIIADSAEFNAATKQWAASLSQRPHTQRDAVREEMRRWWRENRGMLQAKRYREVNPPTK